MTPEEMGARLAEQLDAANARVERLRLFAEYVLESCGRHTPEGEDYLVDYAREALALEVKDARD